MEMIITEMFSITPVGNDSVATADAIKQNKSNIIEYESFWDSDGNPVLAGILEGYEDSNAPEEFMRDVVCACLEGLLEQYYSDSNDKERSIALFLGCPSSGRPGSVLGDLQLLEGRLKIVLEKKSNPVSVTLVPQGNASVFSALERVEETLRANPNVLCIVGAADSLLNKETLTFFEESERLKTIQHGRHHAFSPSQAVGFFCVESEEKAGKKCLAKIHRATTTVEPAPFLSDEPSKGAGLTRAISSALKDGSLQPENINTIVCDLNGEMYRSKEWGFADLRVFGNASGERELLHPADIMGAVGSASGSVLINYAVEGFKNKWFGPHCLVFCSDDEGGRGAVVITRI